MRCRLLSGILLVFCVSAVPAMKRVNIGNRAEPQSLDPHRIVGFYEFQIVQQLFQPLVDLDPKKSVPIPGVAESWKSSPDKLTWTFKLRKNAKWSNGDPVTAQDFVYSWQRLLNPKIASEYAYFAYFIKNGEAYNSGKLADPNQLGVKATSPTELVLTMERSLPYIERILFFSVLAPVHPATVEKFPERWTRPENIVVNGPYTIASWETNKSVVLKKNPNFWDAKNVKMEEAAFLPIENHNTEENMFRVGQLDVTDEVSPDKAVLWKGKPAFHNDPFLNTAYLGFNVAKPPFNDARVRKALSLAIDRERVAKFIYNGLVDPTWTFTPQGTGGFKFRPAKSFASDPVKAKALLKEAGYDGVNKKLPKLDLLYTTNETRRKLCEAIQEMWKQNLGVEVSLRNEEWKVYLTSISKQNYQIVLRRWVGDYDDPITFLELQMSTNSNNNSGYANPAYDKILHKAFEVFDPKRRLVLYQQAEDIIASEASLAPLFVERRSYLLNPKLKGWYPSNLGLHPISELSWE